MNLLSRVSMLTSFEGDYTQSLRENSMMNNNGESVKETPLKALKKESPLKQSN